MSISMKIASAITASNEWKKETNKSAVGLQGSILGYVSATTLKYKATSSYPTWAGNT